MRCRLSVDSVIGVRQDALHRASRRFEIRVEQEQREGRLAGTAEDVGLPHFVSDELCRRAERRLIGRYRNSSPLTFRFDHEHRENRLGSYRAFQLHVEDKIECRRREQSGR